MKLHDLNPEDNTKKRYEKKKTILVVLFTSLVIAIATFLAFNWVTHTDHFHGFGKNDQLSKRYKHGAVTTDNIECARVGRNILQRKGSAVDAAIATSFCVGVYSAHSAGIGGGGVMLVYQKRTQTMQSFDYREEAPGAATENMLNGDDVLNQRLRDGLTVAVPGEVKGLYLAYKTYGKLPWKELLQPAIDLAENGYPLGQRVHEVISYKQSLVSTDLGLREMYFQQDRLKKLTELVYNRKLAATLRRIADNPDDFYTGSLAFDIVNDVINAGGILSLNDLRKYKVKQRNVLANQVNDELKMFAPTVPSGGPIIAFILNVLKGYNYKRRDITDHNKAAETYHNIAEAIKYGYAERTKIGDPDFMNEKYVEEWLKNMTSPAYGEHYRKLIEQGNGKTYGFQHYGAINDITIDHGTSHINVYSSNGDAVALTTSINNWFGSGFRSRRTGIIYNDSMRDFSKPGELGPGGLKSSPMNYIQPYKRPVSSLSPCILLDKDNNVKIIIGGAGGIKITSSVVQGILFLTSFGDALGKAITRPRLHVNLKRGRLSGDPYRPLPPHVINGLKSLGHIVKMNLRIQEPDLQGIFVKSKNRIYAKTEPRRYGNSAGF